MFEYFYNEIFRSVIIGFGTLFNDINIKHKDANDSTWSEIKVPLAYGPIQKFLARLEQTPDLNAPVQMTLPRMSFEFTALEYDPSRKMTQTQSFYTTTPDGSKTKKVFVPVPYNMTIQLSIMTKLNDDMLQIVEQILPYFQPAYTLPINFLGELKEKQNVPVQLDNITMEDDYEGNFDTRRALIYTLTFTAKTYLYGPVSDVTGDIIKKVSVGYIAGTRTTTGTSVERDVTYSVEPRAVKDYDGSQITQLAEDLTVDEVIINVKDGSSVTAKTYIYVGEEEMYVEKVNGNKLTVKRGQDETSPQIHASGAAIFSITKNDANFIEVGDNFGFDGSIF